MIVQFWIASQARKDASRHLSLRGGTTKQSSKFTKLSHVILNLLQDLSQDAEIIPDRSPAQDLA
jgi:hypothetical protein